MEFLFCILTYNVKMNARCKYTPKSFAHNIYEGKCTLYENFHVYRPHLPCLDVALGGRFVDAAARGDALRLVLGGTKGEAEAYLGRLEGWIEGVAGGDAAADGELFPTAASAHALGARGGPLGIVGLVAAVIAVPVAAPFSHVAAHVVQPQLVRL